VIAFKKSPGSFSLKNASTISWTYEERKRELEWIITKNSTAIKHNISRNLRTAEGSFCLLMSLIILIPKSMLRLLALLL